MRSSRSTRNGIEPSRLILENTKFFITRLSGVMDESGLPLA